MTQAIVMAAVYVIVLAVVNMQVVEYLKAPVKAYLDRLHPDQEYSLWWVVYVSFATGTALAFGFAFDAFAFLPAHPYWLGRLLTGCLIGGGSSLIFDVLKRIVTGLASLLDSLRELVAVVNAAREMLGGYDLTEDGSAAVAAARAFQGALQSRNETVSATICNAHGECVKYDGSGELIE